MPPTKSCSYIRSYPVLFQQSFGMIPPLTHSIANSKEGNRGVYLFIKIVLLFTKAGPISKNLQA